MTLADSDDVVVDDIVIASTDQHSPLVVTTNDADTVVMKNDSSNTTGKSSDDTPKASHNDPLATPLSNVTASTSNDESLDDDSPMSNGDRGSESPVHPNADIAANEPSTNITPMVLTESAPSQKQQQPVNAWMGSDIITTTSSQPAVTAAFNSHTNKHQETGAKTLYSLRLPGVGKVLAINSDNSCDVDTLYEQGTKACDVDAFVGNDDNTEDDDDDDSDLPLYSSPMSTMNGAYGTSGYINSNNIHKNGTFRDHELDDLEANRASSTSIIRRIDPPLDPHCDPFAQRVGKKLTWQNVNMTLKTKHGEKKLLNNVWGEVPSTETTAIMGASGAGKTSLLNILAGRARTRGKIRIEADVRLQNYSVDPTSIKIRKSIAFVAQDDSLQITATPREAIRFSAKLRLPRSTTDSQLDLLTTRMLNELGLSACADTIVGGALIKGLSGGERKRASVGVELVVKPAMVFLDEPTSGLDSFSAVQVCQVLKKVANSGASVLFTIHQPSSEIFDSFDRLILLHKGRVLFQGSVKDVPSTFATCGYPVPNNFNPADWVVNVAQKYPIPDLERAGFFQNDSREVHPPTLPLKGQNVLGEPLDNRHAILGKKGEDDPPGLWAQVNLLYRRELAYMYRFPLPLYARFGFTAFLSFLIGFIFFKVGDASPANPFNITSQFGAVMILLMLALLGTAQPALLFFPEERPIFLREYSTDHYSVISYFVSRLLVEMMNTGVQILIMTSLIYFMVSFNGSVWIYFGATYGLAMSGTAMAVMLGVLAEGNAKVAQQLLPLLFIPQLLFSGFFVSPDLMPKFLQWAQYACVLTYAVRLLVVEEFYECSDNATENRNCENLVENVRADPDQTLFYWSMLVVYFIVFRTLALFLLRKSATKFY